ncbi:uncharacterized protein NDAI_0G00170 [Naumovozyma dairenensis CBS 421]|uniref:Uncharacterized protein n=1 Tax=Naumovozyma dairenensis (strain ATCC 10597 / BCRC 20456 / CBS 421 / NBRC 0211 / NRRL Y-12639) TaxID=1071378 RepID=G0WDD2_NAUDC|nr:hypothetical protein NDAI_0G00170 [Naumovozyma dairenensis CBS 421]CCD25793.2 hypothetical protein NDAI_0G00170 [Naumovozyma dairenensis CBS 421]
MYTRFRYRLGGRIELNDSFVDDLEQGFNSRHFDIISNNVDDERSGLDDATKEEIRRIMQAQNISFDKARLLYTERQFNENGIASDGMPLDPKAVTFGRH